jgi:hypothetical protein
MGGVLDNINANHLDPTLMQIIDLIDARKPGWMIEVVNIINNLKATTTAEQFDHALSDIEYTFERRMIKIPH